MVKQYTIGDALQRGIALLKENKTESALADARVLLCHVLSCDKIYLSVHKDEMLDGEDAKTYFELIDRRAKREPVSYILGKKEFMSLEFKVGEGILTPRPDTEILAELVIDKLKNIPAPQITDMCTGSGAIAVSLAKYIPSARVTALDISDTAICTARENALANGVEIDIAEHDVRMPFLKKADAVVSNPPYIPTGDISGLDDDVALYEPHLALDGGSDGLDFYRAIVDNIESALKADGLLAFEVGLGQAEDVCALMSKKFYAIGTAKDLSGIERVVYGYLATPGREQ